LAKGTKEGRRADKKAGQKDRKKAKKKSRVEQDVQGGWLIFFDFRRADGTSICIYYPTPLSI